MTSIPPGLSDFRPLSMGELLDRAAGFWRSHWKPLCQLYLAFHLAGYVLLKLLVWVIRSRFPLLEGGFPLASAVENNPIEVGRQLAIGGVASVPFLALYTWLVWLASIATSRYVVGECLGQSPSAGGSVRHALARAGPATGSLALVGLLGIAACIFAAVVATLIAIAGALLGGGAGVFVFVAGFGLGSLAVLLGFLWYVLRFFLIAPVLAMEELGAVSSIRRSGQLVSGRIGPRFIDLVKVRATVLVTVMMLILLVVTSLGTIPSILVKFAYSSTWDPTQLNPSAVPMRLLIPAELFHVGVQSLFGPLYIALACLFYLDMRVRREGLDLELKLEASRQQGST